VGHFTDICERGLLSRQIWDTELSLPLGIGCFVFFFAFFCFAILFRGFWFGPPLVIIFPLFLIIFGQAIEHGGMFEVPT